MSADFIHEELQAIHREGLHRRLRLFDEAGTPRTRVDGREVVQFASNSYLGLARHPDVVRAAQEAARTYGTGAGGSRLLGGGLRLHRELEEELARFKGTEDAVLFGSGYQANLGILGALAGPDDLVVSDELNHASIIDACRLSRARVEIYRHGDAAHADALLAEHRRTARRAFLVTDGVFSMDGDLAPLRELQASAQGRDALFVVDDAHGTGVLGTRGRGTAEHLGLGRAPEIQMGTLSKALAGEGGFVAGTSDLCDLLRNRARSFVFSTAPSPANVAAARAALRLVDAEPHRRKQLHENQKRLRSALRESEWSVPEGETPILPVSVGNGAQALAFSQTMEDLGVYVPAIRPPTVPVGSARLRATVMATHTAADVDLAIHAFQRAREPLEVAR